MCYVLVTEQEKKIPNMVHSPSSDSGIIETASFLVGKV